MKYKVIATNAHEFDALERITEKLNKEAESGWEFESELQSNSRYIFLLKRKLEDENPL